mgnify:CR=1 FL=1
MKLVKLLDKPLSAVAGIVGIPESEKITTKESLLVSNDRFTLLQFNHVRTHLVKEFSETAIANIGGFDKNAIKSLTCLIINFLLKRDL